jgi:hypothetical protein
MAAGLPGRLNVAWPLRSGRQGQLQQRTGDAEHFTRASGMVKKFLKIEEFVPQWNAIY